MIIVAGNNSASRSQLQKKLDKYVAAVMNSRFALAAQRFDFCVNQKNSSAVPEKIIFIKYGQRYYKFDAEEPQQLGQLLQNILDYAR